MYNVVKENPLGQRKYKGMSQAEGMTGFMMNFSFLRYP